MKYLIIFILFTTLAFSSFAQEAEDAIKEDKPARAAFQSGWLIDNPTGLMNSKGTLQMDIQHRFGVIESGNRDLLGMWGPSNIRLANELCCF